MAAKVSTGLHFHLITTLYEYLKLKELQQISVQYRTDRRGYGDQRNFFSVFATAVTCWCTIRYIGKWYRWFSYRARCATGREQFQFLKSGFYTGICWAAWLLYRTTAAFTQPRASTNPLSVAAISRNELYRYVPAAGKIWHEKANMFWYQLFCNMMAWCDVRNDNYLSVYDIKLWIRNWWSTDCIHWITKAIKAYTPQQMDEDIVKSKAMLKRLGITFPAPLPGISLRRIS